MIPAEEMAARMDPWCVVDLPLGDKLLFGFATLHPATGGLSWTRSSPLVSLVSTAAVAHTRSGRIYTLGRRFDIVDVRSEGEEAWVAYTLLIGKYATSRVALASVTPVTDGLWLCACKEARHLSLPPPPRVLHDIAAFLRQHTLAYGKLRRKSWL